MAVAPLPTTLPGSFLVLEYDRESETFKLHTDDAEQRDYAMGSSVQDLMQRFNRWGLGENGLKAIDFAREFRAVQLVFDTGRIIPLTKKKPPMLVFSDGEPQNEFTQLP